MLLTEKCTRGEISEKFKLLIIFLCFYIKFNKKCAAYFESQLIICMNGSSTQQQQKNYEKLLKAICTCQPA